MTGMRRSGGVEEALRGYSDAQVEDAVKAMCRMVRADDSIRSPFGLLVRFARDGNPDVFSASVRSEPVLRDVCGEPESVQVLERADLAAAVRNQRRELRGGT